MKKLIKSLYVLSALVIVSCSDNLTDLNHDPKVYTDVPGNTFFSNAVRNLTDGIVYGVTFKVLAQQWSETTYTDASRYNLPNIGNTFWNTLYRDVLKDLDQASKVIAEEENTLGLDTKQFETEKANRQAIIDIMEVYTYSILVNTFGDVPYTAALNIEDVHPVYDDAATIYDDLFKRLAADVAALDASQTAFRDGADLIYGDGGNTEVDKWQKFANSLRLRMALTISEAPNKTGQAKTEAEAAVNAPGGVFISNDDNALLRYLGASPNTNQIWVNLVQSGREDYVASNTLVNMMKGLDPAGVDVRLGQYFDPVGGSGSTYSGGTFGISNNYGNFSHVSTKVVAETFPGTLLDYSEIEFYLAEAVSRGFAVGGTVEDHYNAAITASFTYWGGTEGDANLYLAEPGVNFATAAGTDIEKIARQKYIALYNRGLEAWTEYRRFDYPVLNTVPDPLGDFPSRYTYPVNEQNLNEESWSKAAGKLGGDDVTKRVFWDTK